MADFPKNFEAHLLPSYFDYCCYSIAYLDCFSPNLPHYYLHGFRLSLEAPGFSPNVSALGSSAPVSAFIARAFSTVEGFAISLFAPHFKMVTTEAYHPFIVSLLPEWACWIGGF